MLKSEGLSRDIFNGVLLGGDFGLTLLTPPDGQGRVGVHYPLGKGYVCFFGCSKINKKGENMTDITTSQHHRVIVVY